MQTSDVKRVYLAISNAQDGELYFKGYFYYNPLLVAARFINDCYLTIGADVIEKDMLEGRILDGRIYRISYALHCGNDWKIKVE